MIEDPVTPRLAAGTLIRALKEWGERFEGLPYRARQGPQSSR